MTHLLAQVPAGHAQEATIWQIIAPYLPVLAVAAVVCLLLTPLMRRMAHKYEVVDRPCQRKQHARAIAYLGGVAIFAGWLAGVAVSYFVSPHTATLIGIQHGLVLFPISIVLGAAVITLTGLYDDVYGISPRVKVGGQLFAAAALASQDVGLRLVESSFGLIDITLPAWLLYILGTAIIALFVIGACNAMNLLDGMDGLAAGTTSIAAIGFLLIASIIAMRTFNNPEVSDWYFDPIRIVMCLAILGAIIGFLPYNFNPASIFMGDTGSLLLGYLCITTVLLFAETAGNGLLLVTAAMIVFALPILDTALAIFRRKMKGQPISTPDNGHIHHLLRRSGLSVRQSVLTLYGLATVFAAMGVTLVAIEARWRYILAVFFALAFLVITTAYLYGRHLETREKRNAAAHEHAAPQPSRSASIDEQATVNTP